MDWAKIKCPIESLESCVACHSRDWSVHYRDAWLWGIVCGWGDAWDEIAEKHHWEGEPIERLKMLHREFAKLRKNKKQKSTSSDT